MHDYAYSVGRTQEDKDRADRDLKYNLFLFIHENTNTFPLRQLRKNRAEEYYWFVHHCGDDAFWKGKERAT